MHQKQPPAKTAVFVVATDEFCGASAMTEVPLSTAEPIRRRKSRFMLGILDILAFGAL